MNTRDLAARYGLDRHPVAYRLIPADRAHEQPPAVDVSATVGEREGHGYPPVIVVQGREHSSWLREHAGHLIAAAGVGVLGLAVLAVVAIIAVALALAAITSAVAVVAIKAMTASSQPVRRGRRYR